LKPFQPNIWHVRALVAHCENARKRAAGLDKWRLKRPPVRPSIVQRLYGAMLVLADRGDVVIWP
jgi:hypothetical protein